MIKKIGRFFDSRIDKKKFFLIFRIILFLFLNIWLFSSSGFTLSRYVSETEVSIAPRLAFFITDVGTYENTIELDSILPSNSAYLYSFTVANFSDEDKSNVDIEYDIEFITTTNMPLNFKVYKNTTVMSGPGIIQNDRYVTNADGMHFRHMGVSSSGAFSFISMTTDTYVLWVEFPEPYKAWPELYEGIIELVEIKVTARQVV